MPRAKKPPREPEGYRLIPEDHISAIQRALMCRITMINRLLHDGLWSDMSGASFNEFLSWRADALAALSALNPRLIPYVTGDR